MNAITYGLLALEANTELTTVVETALNTVKTDVMSYVGIALPIGLGIAGVFMAIRLGIGFFRSIAH